MAVIRRGKSLGAVPWRSAALLGLAWVLGSQPAPAALPSAPAADVARIEAYLNDLTTLRSKFVQTNPDNATVTGELYYQRPDKIRLDYDPPSPLLIISDGWQIVYYDRKLEQVSYLFPSSTPLGFLLTDEIRLNDEVTVTHLVRHSGEIRLTLVRTDEPTEGTITLTFTDEPIELRRWTLKDAQGRVTRVTLVGLQSNVPLDKDLFRFQDRNHFRKGDR